MRRSKRHFEIPEKSPSGCKSKGITKVSKTHSLGSRNKCPNLGNASTACQNKSGLTEKIKTKSSLKCGLQTTKHKVLK